jgi:tripartite-type tricarboxylate transporter receptor subunit TctC
VQVYFGARAGAAELLRTGKVRALAVTTAQRSSAFPDVPAIGESVPGYEASLRNGLGAPKGTPADIIAKLNAEVNVGLNDAGIKAKFADRQRDCAARTGPMGTDHSRRNREVGQGDPGRQHQGAIG